MRELRPFFHESVKFLFGVAHGRRKVSRRVMQVKRNYWKHIGQSVNDCDVAAGKWAKQVKSFCQMLARTKKKLTVEICWRLHVGQHVSSSNRR